MNEETRNSLTSLADSLSEAANMASDTLASCEMSGDDDELVEEIAELCGKMEQKILDRLELAARE